MSMSSPSLKILVIEDEETVRIGLEDNLTLEGYEVVSCDNGRSGLETFSEQSPDLVILDVMMPEMDGLEVCRHIRGLKPDVPIIMLTAKCGEIDKVLGLEIGADDYLTKPFGMRELFARIKALLRRSQQISSNGNGEGSALEELTFGEVVVDFKSYRASRAGSEISLSAKEFELLLSLIHISEPTRPY